MLESKRLPPEPAEHAPAAIARSAATLAQIVEDLLDTDRIVKGTLRLTPQPVDLRSAGGGSRLLFVDQACIIGLRARLRVMANKALACVPNGTCSDMSRALPFE
jgi:signal transduction histidine kinase